MTKYTKCYTKAQNSQEANGLTNKDVLYAL